MNAEPRAARLALARIFGNHMVLQQNANLPVWGTAQPGGQVVVTLGSQRGEAKADEAGRWRCNLPPTQADVPLELVVRSGDEQIVVHDVLLGEVWVSSGQSNMDFRLKNAMGATVDIPGAAYPKIRYFRVEQVVSRTPRADLDEGHWEVCSPETAGEFSAVAFYFARALQQQRQVPVGIVNATWSGTPAEAWTSGRMLELLPDFKARVREIETSREDWQAGQERTIQADAQREKIFAANEAGLRAGVHQLDFPDTFWGGAEYPLDAVTLHLPEYGAVWLRKKFELSPDDIAHDVKLNLGQVYEWDQTFVNGQLVGSTRWDGVRVYTVPAMHLRAGRNIVAVHLLSEWWAGQLGKRFDHAFVETSRGRRISLEGEWRYNGGIDPALPVGHSYSNEPTALFNGMIAPVIPFRIRGVLWYQGEGNAGNPSQYRSLLAALVHDWRARWEEGHFPFLIVQLPNIDGSIGKNWPEMREAQASVRQFPNVGMITTLDVGDPYNIHPANKRPVGERLCALALRIAYGDRRAPESPCFEQAQRRESQLRIQLSNTEGGLRSADGKAIRGFEIAGKNGKFLPAEASFDGSAIWLSNPQIKRPVWARYAWAPNPDANLVNENGLPAEPFRVGPLK